MRRRDGVAIVVVLVASVLGSLRFAPGLGRLEQRIVGQSIPLTPSCPGAQLPSGWASTQDYPYVPGSISGTAFNPQTVAILAKDSLAASAPGSDCLARWATSALLAHARRVPFTGPDGRRLTALTFPYPFDFTANPALPPLRAGWLSGLAQGSVLQLLTAMYDRTGDPRYLDQARETFDSFLLPASLGGFVTTDHGLTYLQEYPTSVPSYVLNGHSDAAVALVDWARRSGDPVAADLAGRSVAALRTTTALAEVALPTGVASAYDLLRGYPAAPLRVLPGPRGLTVRAAALTDGEGTTLAPLQLAVGAAAPASPDLLGGAGFGSWKGSTPAGWRLAGAGTATPGPPRADGAPTVRLASDGAGTPQLTRDVPASAVVGGRSYTASWTAVVAHVAGSPTAAARVTLSAVCPRGTTELAVADVRSTTPVTESIEGTAVAGCGLRLTFAKADPPERPGTVDLADPALRLGEPVGAAVAPSYPLSVLAVPRVVAAVTYTGSGQVQARFRGRWLDVGTLPAANATANATARLEIPAFAQGRNVNLRYHDDHVGLLARLYRSTGQDWLRDRALSWMRYAPSTEGVRRSLTPSGAG